MSIPISNSHSRNAKSYNFIDPLLQTGSKYRISNENHPHHFFSTICAVNTYVESKLGSEIHSKESQVNRSLNVLINLASREAPKSKNKLNFIKKLFKRKKKKILSFSDKIKISSETNTAVPHVIIVEDENKNINKNDKKHNFYSTFSYKDLRLNRRVKGDKKNMLGQNSSPVTKTNFIQKKFNIFPNDKKSTFMTETNVKSNTNGFLSNDLKNSNNKNHSKVSSIASFASINNMKHPEVKISYDKIKTKLNSFESVKTNFKNFNLSTLTNTERNSSTQNKNASYNNYMTHANSNISSTFLTQAKETFTSNFRSMTGGTTDRNSTSSTTNQAQVTNFITESNSNSNSNQKPVLAIKKIIHKKNKSAVTEVNKKFQEKIREFKQENSISIPYAYRIRVCSNKNEEDKFREKFRFLKDFKNNDNDRSPTNIQLSSIILNTNSTEELNTVSGNRNKSVNFENLGNLSKINLNSNFNFNFTPRQGYGNAPEEILPNLKSAAEESIHNEVKYFQKHGKLYNDPNDHASGHMLKENIKELNSQIDKKGVFIHMNKNKHGLQFFSADRTNVFDSGDDISRINDGASIKFQKMLATKFDVGFIKNEVYGLQTSNKPVAEKKSNLHDTALKAYHSHIYKKMQMFTKHKIKDSMKNVNS